MRVLMAAGGTGGHIFPALAVAEELRAGWEHAERNQYRGEPPAIDFLGTGRGLEARLIPASGFALHTVTAAGLVGMSGSRFARNLSLLPRTLIETAQVLRR